MKIQFYKRPASGFTLIELLVVIAIIGILSSIVLFAVSDAQMKGRDAKRKSEIQEVLKALELHYSDGGTYPCTGTPCTFGNEGFLNEIDAGFYGAGTYLNVLPEEANSRYYYCVSPDGTSITLAVDTENDQGSAMNYCSLTRGGGPNFGCNVWRAANAGELCTSRF